MEGFKYVAVVNLIEDINKKDYGFALYDSEHKGLQVGDLVVTNPRRKDNRILGKVKAIKSLEEYGKGVTAQVIGVVNVDGFVAREAELKRLRGIEKECTEIEKELQDRVLKLRDIRYYEEMAEKYGEIDPELVGLVKRLKSLEAQKRNAGI